MVNLKLGSKNIHGINRIIGLIVVIMGILYVSNVLKAWVYVSTIAYSAVALGLTLIMVFLSTPMKKQEVPRDTLPWYDLLFIIVCLCGTGYVAFFPEIWRSSIETGSATSLEIAFLFSLGLLIIEATRRTVGLTLALTTLLFLVYAPFSVDWNLGRVTTLMYFLPSGIVGSLVTLTFTIITMFMLFGAFLQNTHASKFITDSAMAIAGHWTGGPAKAAVVSSGLIGMITGIGPANAAITGSISIPVMKESGYKPEFAAGVAAVASNGSSIMPPVMGIAAFIMAEFVGMPYWQICVCAFIPALLYYWGIFVQVHYAAKKYKLHGLPKEDLPSISKVLKRGWFYSLPLFLLVYLLAVQGLPVEICGMYAALSTIVIALIDRQIDKKTRAKSREMAHMVISSMADAGEMLVIPAIACAGAGIIIATISASGIGFKLAGWLLDIAGGNQLLLLLVVAAASFVLGINLPPLPCYLIMAVLVAPALTKMGIAPIAAHLFCFYWGLQAEITPPVAVPVFICAGIAKADPIKSGLMACRIGFLSFVLPFMFVYNNSLLMIGPVPQIILDTITAFVAAVFIGASFEGYLLKPLNLLEKVLFIVGGGLLLWPNWQFDIVGVAILVPTLFWHIRSKRRAALQEGVAL
jgi:TRAP transporter 4TM/12TM fusion protein